MLAGQADFAQTFHHTVPVIQVGRGDCRHSHNRIHGRPDVMAHIGQELALGAACRPRAVQRALKRLPALLFLIPLFIIPA